MLQQLTGILLIALSIFQGGIHGLVEQTSLGGNLYLVNRTYRLSESYEPQDLILPAVRRTGSSVKMRPQAAKMLEMMFEDAAQNGHVLVAVSGYRSFDTQRLIYQRKIKTAGSVEKAQLLVAPPGTSEHQLGLAMDVGRRSSDKLNASFGRSKEGQWVRENAHRFGFIIRYKAEWTDITGYADEPWHLRYVGVPHATAIFERDIPLERYVSELSEKMFGEMYSNAY